MPDPQILHYCTQEAAIADISARLVRAELDDRDLKSDVRRLHSKIDSGFLEMKEGLATLRERSRNWGVIGGLVGSVAVAVVSAVILAVVL